MLLEAICARVLKDEGREKNILTKKKQREIKIEKKTIKEKPQFSVFVEERRQKASIVVKSKRTVEHHRPPLFGRWVLENFGKWLPARTLSPLQRLDLE